MWVVMIIMIRQTVYQHLSMPFVNKCLLTIFKIRPQSRSLFVQTRGAELEVMTTHDDCSATRDCNVDFQPYVCVVTTTTAHIHHNTINRFACMPNRSRSQCQGQRGSVGTHRYTQTTGEWTVFVPNRICSIVVAGAVICMWLTYSAAAASASPGWNNTHIDLFALMWIYNDGDTDWCCCCCAHDTDIRRAAMELRVQLSAAPRVCRNCELCTGLQIGMEIAQIELNQFFL